MARFEWGPRLQLDVPEMDSQHKHLIALMGKLEDLSTSNGARSAIEAAFRDLGSACEKHFAEEERYMERAGYKELPSHKVIHRTLLEKFGAHHQAFLAKPGPPEPALFEFLQFWLRSHISGVDRRYADHAHGKAGAPG
jgi:hemerythrin-like metal-binding protein